MFAPLKMSQPMTRVFDLLDQSLVKYNKSDVFASKINGEWQRTSAKNFIDAVTQLSLGLLKIGVKSEAIHGNKSQNARQRALGNFKDRTTRVLVATDIAARGIDVDELSHVINYELPNVPETYVHRIGRTGRAGLNGVAFSFCEHEELPYLKDIQKLIGKEIKVNQDHPYHTHMVVPTKGSAIVKNNSKPNNQQRFKPKKKENFSRQKSN
jgi:ATP-dependent RNA helicase RhlE